MALQGTIRDFGLADILQLLGIQRTTGILTLEGEDDTVTVKFLEGQVVGADTRLRNLEDLLGSVLVRTGRITEAQLQEALRIQRSTLQRLGYILVKSKFISEEDLRDALRIQVTQIVYRLFRWRDGRYHFDRMDRVEYDTEHFTPLSAETILMEGARMIDEWPIIERRIKSSAMVFRKTAAGAELDVPVASLVDADIDFGFDLPASSGEPSAAEEIRLSQEERGVLHMVDGRSTVQDLVDRTPLSEFDVYHALYELLNRNLIEEVRVAAGTGGTAATERQGGLSVLASCALVAAAAVFGLATLPQNPLAPWRLASIRAENDLLKSYASRARVDALDRAVQLFYLDLGSAPEDLDALAAAGYVAPSALMDPWGRPYRLETFPGGYRLYGLDASGGTQEDLTIRHVFSGTQRLILEGPAASRKGTSEAP